MNTASITTNIDQRLIIEERAVAASAFGSSNITVQMLDGGAIEEAFDLGEHALDKVTSMATASRSEFYRAVLEAMDGAFKCMKVRKSHIRTRQP